MKSTLTALAVATVVAGCGVESGKPQPSEPPNGVAAAGPLAIVLVYQGGTNRTDLEIQRRQEQIRAGKQTEIGLERLGWLFVAKARESFDPGFYKLAGQCALALEARQPHSADALLLRGHVLQNLHRFAESEAAARELVAARGLAFDFGVLGDALMEQGKLEEAIDAYQKMADLKPDSQAAARAAHIRWLKGDLAGAIEMMQLAAGAVGAHDVENAAWVFTRFANYMFQAGRFQDAQSICASALDVRPNYPPAMLLRGKTLMAQNKFAAAIEPLRIAEKQNPLPEYQWALLDALNATGETAEASEVEARLLRTGASTDPRSFALFLATHGEKTEIALRLANEELATRDDVFTHDAIAWAQLAAGNYSAAQQSIKLALAEGTQDARLFFHAAIIASRVGQAAVAEKYFQKSSALAHLLLPSERKQLYTAAAQLNPSRAVATSSASHEEYSGAGKLF